MKTPVISIGGRSGRIFEGEVPQTYCFVPEDCILCAPDGVCVCEGDYIRSGWDVRNMRFNDAGTGEHLFPDALRPVIDLESPPVKTFIRRIDLIGAAYLSAAGRVEVTPAFAEGLV